LPPFKLDRAHALSVTTKSAALQTAASAIVQPAIAYLHLTEESVARSQDHSDVCEPRIWMDDCQNRGPMQDNIVGHAVWTRRMSEKTGSWVSFMLHSLAHARSVRAKRQAKTGSIADNLRGNKHIGCDLTQYALRGVKTDETGLINP
jgi:hypothetical protein